MKHILLSFVLLLTSLLAMADVTFTVTVPEGTNACYVAGSMNNWNFAPMTLQEDGTYTLTIAGASTSGLKYKYCSGPGWGYVEKNASGGDVSDRSWAAADVVAKWASVYVDPTTIDPSSVTWTVVGTSSLLGTNWAETDATHDMTLGEDGLFTFTLENVSLAAAGYDYKIAQDHAWTISVPANGNQTLNIAESGVYNITFTYNPSTNTLSAEATLVETVVVVPTVQIAGSFTSWQNNAITLTAAEDGLTCTGTASLEKDSLYEFKLIYSGNWLGNEGTMSRTNCTDWVFEAGKGNCKLQADATGEYVFTVTYATKAVSVTYPAQAAEDTTIVTPPAETVYTMVGVAALFGTGWAETDATHDMTLGTDGLYTYTVEDVTLAAAAYEYKMVVNHVWAGCVPAEGNQTLTIETAGRYDIVFTYNPSTGVLSAEATLLEAVVTPPVTPGDDTEGFYYYKGYINDADVEPSEETLFTNGIATLNVTTAAYLFVIYQVTGVPGVQYMANAYSTDTHCTVTTTGNEKLGITTPGTYTLYLYDNGDGTLELSTEVLAGKTLVGGGVVDALGNVASDKKADKLMIDGQLIIIRDGIRYNALGQQIR